MTKLFRACKVVISTAVQVAPWQSFLCLLESIGVILQVVQPLLIAWLVAAAITGNPTELARAGGAFVASIALEKALCLIGVNARIGQLERVGYAFDTRIAKLTSRIPTLDHLESPRYLDQMQALREGTGSLGVAFNVILNMFADVVRTVGTLALAATADWRLLLVAMASVPYLIATRWLVIWGRASQDAMAQPGRLTYHLLDIGRDAAAGAEARVLGLTGFLRRRLHQAATSWRAPDVAFGKRILVVETTCNLFFFAVTGVVLLLLTSDVVAGEVSVQRLLLAALLVNGLRSCAVDLQAMAREMAGMVRVATRFLWLVDYEREVAGAHSGTTQPGPKLQQGIRLERLTCQYPSGERPALDGLSLDLVAGKVVALVGENGAGKSTLVKLLTGMYRPTDGRILVDNVDLADLDIDAWRNRASGAFQDYASFEFTALESVGIGDLGRQFDRGSARIAISRGAAEGVIAELPNGLDTQLGPVWPGGVGLSGGQWQRIALARGMMREHPLLLVLDEPTAALDATTEHALFERYAAAANAGREIGTVTVLVTHRFSTVAAADLIVVLDDGKLLEQGTHRELLAANGHYAELYRLQARGYV